MLKFNHMKFPCNASVIFSTQAYSLPTSQGLITGLVLENTGKCSTLDTTRRSADLLFACIFAFFPMLVQYSGSKSKAWYILPWKACSKSWVYVDREVFFSPFPSHT
ncbi:hypothetical protein KIL84_022037 [Mauremys mutica]|uniref:Uncharacterized protein n=1 Tax=Mauremys mutica TaxID=74926 RepID=A0A9D3XD61_9SAUR|nr:hypothetical protein KIL84_022037 [Mauremys mutica]